MTVACRNLRADSNAGLTHVQTTRLTCLAKLFDPFGQFPRFFFEREASIRFIFFCYSDFQLESLSYRLSDSNFLVAIDFLFASTTVQLAAPLVEP